MEQALSLPEIRNYLCLFIHPSDYRSCALVSRAWFKSITPWLWYSFTFSSSVSSRDFAVLHKYRAFLRVLRLSNFGVQIDIHDWFDNLQALHFYHIANRTMAPEHVADLIRLNRSSLRRISFECYGSSEPSILRVSHECLSLKHLHYSHLKLRERDLVESFVKICTRLTSLNLQEVEFGEETHLMFKDQMFAALEQLKMMCVEGPYLDILKACPNLKVLTVFRVAEFTTEELVGVITTHCKRLSALNYYHPGFNTDDKFEMLALRLPPMKYLQVLSLNTFKSILPLSYYRHYKTLQAIRMVNRSKDDGKDTQTILSSCPSLRWFEGDFIYAEDIESGSPWVCQRLEHLQVDILVRSDDHRHDSAACAQLSQLKKLRTLDLSMTSLDDRKKYRKRSISLRLGEGLELLASLSKLEHFSVGYSQPNWRVVWRAGDIEWMAQAWPNLVAVYGGFIKVDEIYSRICKEMGVSRVREYITISDSLDFIER